MTKSCSMCSTAILSYGTDSSRSRSNTTTVVVGKIVKNASALMSLDDDFVTGSQQLPLTALDDDFQFSLFPIPGIVVVGLIGIVGIVFMLSISFVCHHIRAHNILIKDLERSGYGPNESWRRSSLYQLSLYVGRHDNIFNWHLSEKLNFLSKSCATDKQTSSDDAAEDDDDEQSDADIQAAESHELRSSGPVSTRHRASSESEAASALANAPSHVPIFRSKSGNSPVSKSPTDSGQMSTIGDFVLKSLNPSLVLTSIAEEHELTMPTVGSSPATSTSFRRNDSMMSVDSIYDPDLLKRVLTLDLIELHQHLREFGEGDPTIGEDVQLDEQIGNEDADSKGLSFDLSFRDSPVSFRPESSVFAPDEDINSLQVTSPLLASSLGDSEPTEEAPLLTSLPPAPPPSPTPSMVDLSSLSLPVAPSSPATAAQARQAATNRLQHQQAQRPLHAQSRHSHHSRPSSSSTQAQTQQQQRGGVMCSSGHILTSYAKRIGDAYATDFF